MIKNSQKSHACRQAGVSLIITSFIMIIILAVVLLISTLLYSEIKIMKNMGNSTAGLFAADSGVEKILFYNNQVLPIVGIDQNDNNVYGQRGICTAFDEEQENYCPKEGFEDSILCQNYRIEANDPEQQGCDPDKCDNCLIYFETFLDPEHLYSYVATAQTYPSEEDPTLTELKINSIGSFWGAQRKLEISISAPKAKDAIVVGSACATPKSAERGEENIDILVDAGATLVNDTIGSVTATIKDSNGAVVASGLQLDLIIGSYIRGTWRYTWETSSLTPLDSYYVDIDITDTKAKYPEPADFEPANHKRCSNLKPVPDCYQPPSCEDL